jgi:hypothetical protein
VGEVKRLLCVLLVLLLGCSADSVTRDEWQAMSATDKSLYVKSLLGAEQVKDSKGGNGRVFDQPAEEYVKRIDEAYARDDRRDAAQIFDGMARTAPRRN